MGGNTLTPVPLAGTKFCGGEHTVQGSACEQVTSSCLLTFLPNSLSLRMIHPVLKKKKKPTDTRAQKRLCGPTVTKGGGPTQTFTCAQGQAASWESMICSRNRIHSLHYQAGQKRQFPLGSQRYKHTSYLLLFICSQKASCQLMPAQMSWLREDQSISALALRQKGRGGGAA